MRSARPIPIPKPPFCKGFLYLHDNRAPTMKMMHWRTVMFVLGRDKVLSYSKHGSEVQCGNVSHLIEYRQERFEELPPTWVGFRLAFDPGYDTPTPVLHLAARTEKEALKWLDEIASVIPRFQSVGRRAKPKEYAVALERPICAPVEILQRRGLMARQMADFQGWQVLHAAQVRCVLRMWVTCALASACLGVMGAGKRVFGCDACWQARMRLLVVQTRRRASYAC